MEIKAMEMCQNGLQQRLGKYDVNNFSGEKEKIAEVIKDGKDEYNNKNPGQPSEVSAIELLKEIYQEEYSKELYWYKHLTGMNNITTYRELRVPEVINDIYLHTWNTLEIFTIGPWWLYEKDVLRAVAYHEYISDIHLKETEVISSKSLYDQSEYMNFPIDLRFQIKQDSVIPSYFYAFPNIGGILNNQIYGNGNFKNIFKKNSIEFDSLGNYKEAKKKGINYETLKMAVKDITDKPMSSSDIWLFKNVLDPELITSVYQAIEKTSIRQRDYELIWIICGCKCPSVRLYIFEAIKPCYLYIRNFIKSNDSCMNYFMRNLTQLIADVNYDFEWKVNVTLVCFEQFSVSSEAVMKYYPKLEESFQNGDDFPFILESKAVGSKYYKYMLDESNLSLNKISYSLITALNEQFNMSNKEKQNQQNAYQKAIQAQEKYEVRLVEHLGIGTERMD